MTTQAELIDGDLRLTRIFDAPQELVYAAWTEPSQVSQWWGCAQTTAVSTTVDLRVGGEYRHVMQIEGAGEMVQVGTFTEIDPPHRLAYSTPGCAVDGMEDLPDTVTTVDFVQLGERTELRLTISGLAGTVYQEIVSGGWHAGIDKLDALLAQRAA